MSLRVESVRTLEELDAHADAWNLLALNNSNQHPVLTHAWISAYLKTSMKPNMSWFCLFAFDGQKLVGVLLLLSRETRFFGRKCLLLHTPKTPHTKWVDFLFMRKYEKSVIQLFSDYLNDMRPRVIRVTMTQVVYKSPTIDLLKRGIRGFYPQFQPFGYESVIPVNGTFLNYKESLPSKLKGNLRRSNNALKKLGNYDVVVAGESSDARHELLQFVDIEKSGWKGKAETAIKFKHWEFFEQLVQNLSQKNWLRWYYLESDKKRIAGYLTIPFGRSIVILKTGYNEEYRTLSPGAVLTEKMIEHIFASGEYEVINFLTDYNWLLRWNVEQNQYYRIVIGLNNWLSLLSTRIPYFFFDKTPLVQKLLHFRFRSILKNSKDA